MHVAMIIANPAAGGGRVWQWIGPIRAWAENKFGLCTLKMTQSRGHGRLLAQKAIEDGYRWIIALGGDGTLSEVAWGFFNDEGRPITTQAYFVPLPMGTGNDFAKSVGLQGWTPAKGSPWSDARVKSIDIGRVILGDGSVRTFINMASLGLSTVVNSAVEKKLLRTGLAGTWMYLLATLRAWRHFDSPRIRFTIDDKSHEQSVTLMVLANGRVFGGGMRIAPHATIDDGWIDVLFVDPLTRVVELLRDLPALYRGTHLKSPLVHTVRARVVRIEAVEPAQIAIELDGEVCGMLPIQVDLLPQALRVFAPF